MSRRLKSTKNDAFLLSDPPRLAAPHARWSSRACWSTNGLRELKIAVAVHKHERAAQLVGAGLGQNLDSAETEPVVLGGKRVLVDANLADGFLGRQLAAAEPIDVDLAAVGAGAGTGQGLERIGQVVGIVRQRFQIARP